jgi:hypothetical protein
VRVVGPVIARFGLAVPTLTQALSRQRERVPKVKASPSPYSAATFCRAVTLAAQNLNSGIFPNGSSAGLVSRLTAASA